jgi:hypothetical protein
MNVFQRSGQENRRQMGLRKRRFRSGLLKIWQQKLSRRQHSQIMGSRPRPDERRPYHIKEGKAGMSTIENAGGASSQLPFHYTKGRKLKERLWVNLNRHSDEMFTATERNLVSFLQRSSNSLN